MIQFEVGWADLPQPAGRRPVLLLTRTPAYDYLSRIVVAEITTHVRGIPQEVPLGKREGLPRACLGELPGEARPLHNHRSIGPLPSTDSR